MNFGLIRVAVWVGGAKSHGRNCEKEYEGPHFGEGPTGRLVTEERRGRYIWGVMCTDQTSSSLRITFFYINAKPNLRRKCNHACPCTGRASARISHNITDNAIKVCRYRKLQTHSRNSPSCLRVLLQYPIFGIIMDDNSFIFFETRESELAYRLHHKVTYQ